MSSVHSLSVLTLNSRRRQNLHRITDRTTDRITDHTTDRNTDRITDRTTDWIADWTTDRITDHISKKFQNSKFKIENSKLILLSKLQ